MISIGMSTSCAFPLGLEAGFRLGRIAGYDGIEVMVTSDSATQTPRSLLALSDKYSMPILAIHAPVLLLTTQRLGPGSAASSCCARPSSPPRSAPRSVVVHPPFRWQAELRHQLRAHRARGRTQKTGIEICVENMFPWKIGGKRLKAYAPSPDPLDLDVDAHDARLLARLAVGPRLARDGDGDGRPAAPHPPLRRHASRSTRATSSTSTSRPAAARSRSPRRCSTSPRAAGTAQIVAEVVTHKVRDPQEEARPADRDGRVRARAPRPGSRAARAAAGAGRCDGPRRAPGAQGARERPAAWDPPGSAGACATRDVGVAWSACASTSSTSRC